MSTTIETLKNSNGFMLALAAVAFLFTAVLVFFIIRMLIGGRLRMPGGRTRQARLGIVDAFDLDRQRQLILVRRDNTEHLIMIGGPNDLLIESEIVRIEARDLRRDKAPEFPGGSSDGRIPAPFAQPAERQDTDIPTIDPAQGSLAIQPDAATPALPLADGRPDDPPFATTPQGEPPAQRTPTFPLPPRRPPPPERRVPPRPLEPPRSTGPRVEPPPMDVAPAPRPIVEVPAEPRMDAPVAIEVAPAASAPPPVVTPPTPLVAPPAATPRTTPPSFLKPLPPRPPIRPLMRSNPRLPAAGGEPAPSNPLAAAPGPLAAPTNPPAAPPSPPAAPPAVVATPDPVSGPVIALPPEPEPVPVAPPVAESPPVVPASEPIIPEPEPKDALESLEEEMAKLLGRGPAA